MHGLLFSLLLAVSSPAGAAPDIVVVCPAEFRETMQPWVEQRTNQGHVVRFVSNDGSAQEVRKRIREAAQEGKLRFVVLVGDAPPPGALLPRDNTRTSRLTPTFRVPSKVNLDWGGGPDFASDNPYADLDDDGAPDVAIGRLTAHSTEELATMLRKTLAYEQCHDYGPWRTQINFVAGQGGFGELADSILESVVRTAVMSGVPASYQATLTYASWHSQFCPDPHAFHDRCLERFNEHSLFCVYMGHGSPQALERAVFPDCIQSVLRCDDCRRLHCDFAPPIALFFCCYAGAFAEPGNCLAEELLCNPQGSVAVLAGSNVTMPYSMTVLGREAMHEYFVEHRATIGELIMHAKRSTIAESNSPLVGLVSSLTAAITPNYSPDDERRECVQLFNLLGDPTLQLFYPRTAVVSAPSNAAPGQTIEVRGQSPVDGPAVVELLLDRNRLRGDLRTRDKYSSAAEARRQFESTYQMANDPRVATAPAQVINGSFSAKLTAPPQSIGPCHVRIFVSGANECALGACDIRIVAANADSQKTPQRSALAPIAPIGAAVVAP